MLYRDEIHQWAAEIGFDGCGITTALPLIEAEQRFRKWLQAGHHASLDYLTRHTEKRFAPDRLVEGAKTVIVCYVGYKNAVSEGYSDHCTTKVASYACNRDYHLTVKEMLHTLLQRIRATHPEVSGRAFVDSAPLAEKSLAVAAGLGWIGRNSLLITPRHGSFIHLGELVLTTEADRYDEPFGADRCGSCRACIDHCPTQAILDGERMIDASRCIACHTIEREPDHAIDLDGWIFGCDSCQHHCPYNQRAPHHANPAFTPIFDPRDLTAQDWQTMSEEAFTTRFGETPILRAGLRRIQRNCKPSPEK